MVLESSKKMLKGGVRLAAALFLFMGLMSAPAMAAENAAAAAVVTPAAAPVAAEPVEHGDASIGEQLFKGEVRLVNGGPPCISCHSISVGALNGGVLGPNLTKIYADPTKNGFVSDAWINGGGSPVMGPIFAEKNITEGEVNNLRAFFQKQSKGEVAGSATGGFVIIGLAGFIGILIIFSIIWAGRYSKRAGNTAHDALWRNYGGKGGR
ncbi:MAG: hypothetical protein HZB82_07060 [Deltaproteobacteria bacterium]|nr:hypothetical protein [Deltaproteobacteria bacterium]